MPQRHQPLAVVAAASAVKARAPVSNENMSMLLLSLIVVSYIGSFVAAVVNEVGPAFSTPRSNPSKDA